jgi:hypothetical protein
MGLKAGGEYDEYTRQFGKALQQEYHPGLDKLLGMSEDESMVSIGSAGYSAEKLNALAQLLYVFAGPFKADHQTELTLAKARVSLDFFGKAAPATIL